MEKILKPDISISDPAFNPDDLSASMLAIDISWDRIAYGVYNNSRSCWEVFESWSTGKLQLPGQLLDKIQQIKEASSFLNKNFRQVRLLWGGLRYTLIPSALFVDKQADTYFNFNHPMQAGNEVMYDSIKNIDAQNIYDIPLIIKESLHQLFPSQHFKHYISNLADNLLVRFKNSETTTNVFVNVSAQSYDLLIIKDRRLIFCNTYEYRTSEDFLYYILFAFEQLQISPEQNGIILSGEILKPSAIIDLLTKYVKDVSFITRNPAWKYSHVFDELPEHLYYNLLNILTCE